MVNVSMEFFKCISLDPNWYVVGLTAVIAFYTWRMVVKTHDLVKGSEKSSSMQLRAYLNVVECYAEWEQERNLAVRVVVFTVQFRNTGQTPARDVTCWANINNAAGTPKFEGPADDLGDHMGVSGPGQTGTLRFQHQFETPNADQIEMWTSGRMTLYVYGKIVYNDAFAKQRTTHFRYLMPQDGVNDKVGRFKHAGAGNDWT